MSEEDDLHDAARIFLRGPVRVGAWGSGGVEIGDEAVGRVVAHLRACDPNAVMGITDALGWHRRVCTTASREAVIEAVAVAVAQQNLIDSEPTRWA